MHKLQKYLLFTTILIISFLCSSCKAGPDQPFIIGADNYKNDYLSIQEIPQTYVFNQKIKLSDDLEITIDVTVDIPSIEVTSFVVSPSELDMDKLLTQCMETSTKNVDCIKTKEGFQTGRLYTYEDRVLAINNDDAFLTFFTLETQKKQVDKAKKFSEETAVLSALHYLQKIGLAQDIREVPEKINYLDDQGLYEITFGKTYFGLQAETKSYINIASTQGFPVDGEYITMYISTNGVESFNGILKKIVEVDKILPIISLEAIINNMNRYVDLVPFSIGNNLIINQIELKYVATPIPYKLWSTRYVLAWKLSGMTNQDMPYFIYINALDGSLIY